MPAWRARKEPPDFRKVDRTETCAIGASYFSLDYRGSVSEARGRFEGQVEVVGVPRRYSGFERKTQPFLEDVNEMRQQDFSRLIGAVLIHEDSPK